MLAGLPLESLPSANVAGCSWNSLQHLHPKTAAFEQPQGRGSCDCQNFVAQYNVFEERGTCSAKALKRTHAKDTCFAGAVGCTIAAAVAVAYWRDAPMLAAAAVHS